MAVNFNLSEVSFFSFLQGGGGVVIDKKNTLVMSEDGRALFTLQLHHVCS